jgi:site-specific recombinase XerD
VADAYDHLVDTYLTWLQHNRGRSDATVAKYRGHLERFAAWFADPPEDPALQPLGADPLSASPADLDLYAGLVSHSRKLTAASRRPLVSALRGFNAWLAKGGHIAGDVAASLPQPKAGSPLPHPALLHEAEQLLMAPDIGTFIGLRDTCMLMLLMGCGIRVSGLCGLNESALEWMVDDGGRELLTIRVTEKGKKERLVPAPVEAGMLLRAYLGHEELHEIPRTLPDGDVILFPTTRNRLLLASDYYGEARRMTSAGVRDMIKKYAAAAKIRAKVAHPHALRHLYGTEMAEDRVDLLELQSLFGHVDPKSTAIYTATARRRLRETVDRSNPLAKMRAPILDSLRTLGRTLDGARHARARPPAVEKSKSP